MDPWTLEGPVTPAEQVTIRLALLLGALAGAAAVELAALVGWPWWSVLTVLILANLVRLAVLVRRAGRLYPPDREEP